MAAKHLPGSILDRMPPHDVEAEEAVIAMCLVDPETMARCAEMLAPADFFREQNGEIFGAALRVFSTNSVVDSITVSHALAQRDELENVGGSSELMRMIAHSPPAIPEAGEWYARIVKKSATQRSVIAGLSQTIVAAYAGEDPEDLFAQGEAALHRIRTGSGIGGRGMDAEEAARSAFDEIVMFLDDPRRLRGYSTPWWRINHLLDGLVKGRLITWGAATSVGKSLAVQNVTRDLAIAGVPVLMFTTEMSPEEVQTRLAYMHAGVDPFEIRARGFTMDREREAVFNAIEVVRHWPLRFEPGTQTPASIRARSRLYRDLMGVAVVIVDHMGQGFVQGSGDSETERIGSVTSGLKNLAADEDLVVLAVSHVNRDSRRENRLLQLRDLYGSVHIEQDSSQVVLLTPVRMEADTAVPLNDHEAATVKANTGGIDVWFDVAKNRFGATGGTDLWLSWAHHGGRFLDAREKGAKSDAGTQGDLVA